MTKSFQSSLQMFDQIFHILVYMWCMKNWYLACYSFFCYTTGMCNTRGYKKWLEMTIFDWYTSGTWHQGIHITTFFLLCPNAQFILFLQHIQISEFLQELEGPVSLLQNWQCQTVPMVLNNSWWFIVRGMKKIKTNDKRTHFSLVACTATSTQGVQWHRTNHWPYRNMTDSLFIFASNPQVCYFFKFTCPMLVSLIAARAILPWNTPHLPWTHHQHYKKLFVLWSEHSALALSPVTPPTFWGCTSSVIIS